MFYLIDEPLNNVSLFIAFTFKVPRFFGIGFWRYNVDCALFRNIASDCFCAIGFIACDATSDYADFGQNFNGCHVVVNIALCKQYLDGSARPVDDSMDFGVFTASGCTYTLICFCVFCPFLAPAEC